MNVVLKSMSRARILPGVRLCSQHSWSWRPSTVRLREKNSKLPLDSTPEPFTLHSFQRPCPSPIAQTAAYLNQSFVPLLRDLDLPSSNPLERPKICPTPSNPDKVSPEPLKPLAKVDPESKAVEEIQDPLAATRIRKYAQRMVRLRKRKMKVHQRRKRRRLRRVQQTKWIQSKKCKEEIEFRLMLMDKVNQAKKFDAQKEINDYLADMNAVLIPKTYKGKRLPEFLIKELLEKDELEKKAREAGKLNIITHEPLVKDGETVEEFEKRICKQYGWDKK